MCHFASWQHVWKCSKDGLPSAKICCQTGSFWHLGKQHPQQLGLPACQHVPVSCGSPGITRNSLAVVQLATQSKGALAS